MGRKTFGVIGKPLPNRHTLVISRQLTTATGCVVVFNAVARYRFGIRTRRRTLRRGRAEDIHSGTTSRHGVFLSEVHQTAFPKG